MKISTRQNSAIEIAKAAIRRLNDAYPITYVSVLYYLSGGAGGDAAEEITYRLMLRSCLVGADISPIAVVFGTVERPRSSTSTISHPYPFNYMLSYTLTVKLPSGKTETIKFSL